MENQRTEWRTYEQVATYLLRQMVKEFGLETVKTDPSVCRRELRRARGFWWSSGADLLIPGISTEASIMKDFAAAEQKRSRLWQGFLVSFWSQHGGQRGSN